MNEGYINLQKGYDPVKRIEALQSAIEIYIDCEETHDVAKTLTEMLIEETEKLLDSAKDVLDFFKGDC